MPGTTLHRPLAQATVVLLLLTLAVSGAVAAQEHVHGSAPMGEADPLLRVMLEGPHLALAHDGFIVYDQQQVAALRRERDAVCAAEVRFEGDRAGGRVELAGLLARGADEGELRAALERLARLDTERTLTLVGARAATLSLLRPAQRDQLAWLRDHWLREATAMIEAATQPGHRGHPGMQLPVRVPGMVVAATTLAPFCEALHGPAVHLSMPPPPP